ncbi:MAG: ABC transporter permease [Bdellovibrionales bacterium]|nr:ABC transporter permease [Bdellovibrionales bacterium]
MTTVVISSVSSLGSWVIGVTKELGAAVLFLMRTLPAIVFPPVRWQLFLAQAKHIGADSLLVVSLIGLFTGAVLAVQGEYTLSQFGATAFTGSAVALSLIRELGPVLTALMVIGRAGSAITAEIGIMRITEQVDALRSMAVDPMRYLMAPRLLAGTLVMPLLASVFIVVGIFGGYIVATGLLGLSSGTFISQMVLAVDTFDVMSGLVKAVVFGFIFGWVSCYKGFTCGYGAIGVNRATTQSVVTASVAVLVVDYFLTSMLTRLFMG